MPPIPDPAAQRPRRRWRLPLMISAAVLLLLAGLWMAWLLQAQRALARAEALAAEVGLMTDPAQLRPPLAEGENAAELLEQALTLFCSDVPGRGYLPMGRDQGEPHAEFVSFIEDYAEERHLEWDERRWQECGDAWNGERSRAVRDLIARAVERPVLYWQRHLAKGPGMLLPEIAAIRAWYRWLALGVEIDRRAGRSRVAADGLLDGLQLAVLYQRGSDTLIEYLVGLALQAVVCAELTELAPHLTAQQRLRLVSTATEARPLATLAHCLDAEQALFGSWAWAAFEERPEEVTGLLLDGPLSDTWYATPLALPLRLQDQANYLTFMARHIRFFRDGGPPPPDLSVLLSDADFLTRLEHLLTGMLVPAMEVSHRNAQNARRDLAFLVTAVGLQEQSDSGATPAIATVALPPDLATVDRNAWILDHGGSGSELVAPPPFGDSQAPERRWSLPAAAALPGAAGK